MVPAPAQRQGMGRPERTLPGRVEPRQSPHRLHRGKTPAPQPDQSRRRPHQNPAHPKTRSTGRSSARYTAGGSVGIWASPPSGPGWPPTRSPTRPPAPAGWSLALVDEILSNPKYTGHQVMGRRRRKGGKNMEPGQRMDLDSRTHPYRTSRQSHLGRRPADGPPARQHKRPRDAHPADRPPLQAPLPPVLLHLPPPPVRHHHPRLHLLPVPARARHCPATTPPTPITGPSWSARPSWSMPSPGSSPNGYSAPTGPPCSPPTSPPAPPPPNSAATPKPKTSAQTRQNRHSRTRPGHRTGNPRRPSDPAAQALRNRIRARFTELYASAPPWKPNSPPSKPPPPNKHDPTLLDELPTLGTSSPTPRPPSPNSS